MTIGDRHTAVVTERDPLDRLYRVMGVIVTESIRASVIVLLVQMNRGILNTGTGDNVHFRLKKNVFFKRLGYNTNLDFLQVYTNNFILSTLILKN